MRKVCSSAVREMRPLDLNTRERVRDLISTKVFARVVQRKKNRHLRKLYFTFSSRLINYSEGG